MALTGLLARRVAGDGVGLLAAALAAFWPNLVVTDGTLMSETVFTLVVVLVLLVLGATGIAAGWRALADRPASRVAG